ncbi:MAG: assimilatory sulfite reductase (NADPH) hemoprotein subunit [Alcaligenaceae bacterium]|jgi:sulfite reductase (NADPH) hemoprotein beta-component|nr:assimilatory sulfite reductase (NADPH) hemoprotein subunit [Alcaligenaceae bacterium]HZJ97666.1 assimilatory sulfite reductase (NADPH) hemoprotein subunit [Oligella sp.]
MSKDNLKNDESLAVDGPLSDNERLKGQSDYLRGGIATDLQDGLTGGFRGDNFQLIRFHGMYEQDDRDIRASRVESKLEPKKNVMLRCRLPGGIITPQQWLGIDKFATEHTDYGSIRITNRQTFQFHGVLKDDIKPMHQWLHELGLDSLATAGDVNRNVLCTSNPVESSLHEEAYEWAKKISEHLLPKTNAYADIWLDGEKLFSTEHTKPITKEATDPTEPILGKTYLPRKFKTAVVIPPHNDVDLHANDLNFIAIGEEGKLVGFNVLVGGGLSFEHGNTKTFPELAYEFGFVKLDDVLKVAEAVVTTQRDWGNRTDRKNAKTRYTIQRVGLERFIEEVATRAGITFEATRPYEFISRGDRIGWVEGIDKKWHLTLFIENGRLLDYPGRPLKTGVRKIAEIHKGDFRLTANQNIIVANVPTSQKKKIEKIARDHALIVDSITPLRKQAMACVSLPTCPLAMAEAERFLPSFVDTLDEIMAKHGVEDETIITRITGCPNGCGRAMLAEIALVGKAPGRYNLHVGGNLIGTRIPKLYKENIATDEIIGIIDGWVKDWSEAREVGESFGDFAIRREIVKPVVNAATDFWAN